MVVDKKNIPSDFNTLVSSSSFNVVSLYIKEYNKWINNQLKSGGLIFSPEDYYGIWRSSL